jgi:hypothetical protein
VRKPSGNANIEPNPLRLVRCESLNGGRYWEDVFT